MAEGKSIRLVIALFSFLSLVMVIFLFTADSHAASDEALLDKAWTAYNIGKYQQVLKIVKPLAIKGNPKAQVMMGNCFAMGLGVPADHAIAAQWYQLAAEQNDPQGLAEMGYCYVAGFGVPKDFTEAVRYMVAAASLGDPGAIETLNIWKQEGRVE